MPFYLYIYKNSLNKYCNKTKLINAKSIGQSKVMEYSYHVNFKNKDNGVSLVRDLKNIKGVNHVNLYFDEEFI